MNYDHLIDTDTASKPLDWSKRQVYTRKRFERLMWIAMCILSVYVRDFQPSNSVQVIMPNALFTMAGTRDIF